MIYSKLISVLAFSAVGVLATPAPANKAANAGGATAAASGGDQASLTLNSANLCKGCENTGEFTEGFEAGNTLSLTSDNNYINFCDGQEITNGLQVPGCNPVPWGEIPTPDNIMQALITNPRSGDQIPADTTFEFQVTTINFAAGHATNADSNFMAAPQQLINGQVAGHTHMCCQNYGSDANPTTPQPGTTFAFFEAINDAGDGQGHLSVNCTGGLPAGTTRCCTLHAAANHQNLGHPVAQHMQENDCVWFTVTGNGNTPNVDANDQSGGQAAAAKVLLADQAFSDSAVAASISTELAAQFTVVNDLGVAISTAAAADAAATTTSAAAAGGAAGKGGKGAAAAASTSAAAATSSTAAAGAANAKGAGGAKGAAGAKAAGAGAATTSAAAAATESAAAGGAGAKAVGGKAAGTGAAAAGSTGAAAAGQGAAGAKGGAAKKFGKGRKQRFMRRDFAA